MKYSEYYNMNLPENSDYALIEPLNENTQAIDAELKNRENALIAHDASVESHPDILAQIRNINDGMDNVYTKPETDDLVSGAVSTHNADEAAHPYILHQLANHGARIKMLEDYLYNDITGNPHMITFTTLDGLIVTGVWNEAQARLEC